MTLTQTAEIGNSLWRTITDAPGAHQSPKTVAAEFPPLNQRARALDARGYGNLMLPIIPCGAAVSGQSRPANGKVPGSWTGTNWRNAWNWTKAPPIDLGTWKTLPAGTGIGIRTGFGPVAFDIDIKVDPSSMAPHDVQARRLAAEIRDVLAERFGLSPNGMPRRERPNSTSTVYFARTEDELYKEDMFFEAGGHRHQLEFLAIGQQVVVSGMHQSGVPQVNTLTEHNLSDLPLVDEQGVSVIFARIREKAEALGYTVGKKPSRKPGAVSAKVRDPVTRAALERKREWLPDVLGLGLNVGNAEGELRIGADHLDRELEEDLTIYPDGIYDWGTRRAHNPVSLICEFGEIDDNGEIHFGGSPEYQPGEGEVFDVADDSARRPTPAQAVTWLCRRLGSDDFPSYAGSSDWKCASLTVAQAMGYKAADLEIARVFEFVDWQGFGKREPGSWDADDIRANGRLLASLRITNPLAFAHLLDRWATLTDSALSVAKVGELIAEGLRAEPHAVERAPKATSDLPPLGWIDPSRDWQGVEPLPREWEVEGWIPRGEVTLLYGDGGIGKTLLAHQYATAAATGRSWLGQITRPARVMCIFCEDSAAELHRRQIDINRSLGVSLAELGNLRLVSRNFQDNFIATFDRKSQTLAKTAFWHQIREDAIAFDADVLILDTIADIYAGSEIDRVLVNDFVKRFLGGLGRSIGGSVIALGHPSAAGKSSGDGTSGSTGWNNASRSRLYLQYPGKAKSGDIRQLTNMKLNYGAKGAGLKLRWNRGAFDVLAGSVPAALRDASASGAVPSLNDAAESAVVSALLELPGLPMSDKPRSVHFAPRVLERRASDILAAFSLDDITNALHRLEARGTIRFAVIGKNDQRQKLYGYIVIPDKVSAKASSDAGVFE
jgi:hypothetical protein